MIGTGTLKYDNPRLNVRSVFQGVNVPAKSVRPVLLDSQLSIVGADVISLEKPIIFTCVDPKDLRWSKAISIVKRLGGELVTCNSDENGR